MTTLSRIHGMLVALSVAAATEDHQILATRSYPGAAPPPPGVTPNLQHPSDQGHTASLAVAGVLIVLTTSVLAARVYTKARIIREFYLEDLSCIIAWLLFTVYAALLIVLTLEGGGYPSWDLSPDQYSEFLKWAYASSLLYSPAAFFTKATLLLLIARVFNIRATVSRIVNGFLIFLVFAYLPLQFTKIFVCTPIRTYWDRSTSGTCLNQRAMFLFDSTLAVVTDLIILLLPIPLAWQIGLPIRKKLKIVAILGAGGVAAGMTIYRLVKVVEYAHVTNVSGAYVALRIPTICELAIGFICSCMPAISLLVDWLRHPRLVSSVSTEYSRRRWLWKPSQTSDSPTSTGPIVNTPVAGRTIDHELEMLSQQSLREAQDRPIGLPAGYGAGWTAGSPGFQLHDGDLEYGTQHALQWPEPSAPLTSADDVKSRSSSHRISRELAKIHCHRQWDEIWDGTQRPSPHGCHDSSDSAPRLVVFSGDDTKAGDLSDEKDDQRRAG